MHHTAAATSLLLHVHTCLHLPRGCDDQTSTIKLLAAHHWMPTHFQPCLSHLPLHALLHFFLSLAHALLLALSFAFWAAALHRSGMQGSGVLPHLTHDLSCLFYCAGGRQGGVHGAGLWYCQGPQEGAEGHQGDHCWCMLGFGEGGGGGVGWVPACACAFRPSPPPTPLLTLLTLSPVIHPPSLASYRATWVRWLVTSGATWPSSPPSPPSTTRRCCARPLCLSCRCEARFLAFFCGWAALVLVFANVVCVWVALHLSCWTTQICCCMAGCTVWDALSIALHCTAQNRAYHTNSHTQRESCLA